MSSGSRQVTPLERHPLNTAFISFIFRIRLIPTAQHSNNTGTETRLQQLVYRRPLNLVDLSEMDAKLTVDMWSGLNIIRVNDHRRQTSPLDVQRAHWHSIAEIPAVTSIHKEWVTNVLTAGKITNVMITQRPVNAVVGISITSLLHLTGARSCLHQIKDGTLLASIITA